jgi:hypothetical protein
MRPKRVDRLRKKILHCAAGPRAAQRSGARRNHSAIVPHLRRFISPDPFLLISGQTLPALSQRLRVSAVKIPVFLNPR